MVEGRSKKAFKQWLAERAQAWRERVEVLAMDGFTGLKTAAAEELPDAVAVMDPTGADLLTDQQCARLTALFAAEEHIEVEATWGIYQPMITAYREPDRKQGRDLMPKLIESVSHGVPAALTELRRLGPTLTDRAADVLAYFDRPGTSNGPTEAINGRLEHLRGSALGFPQPHQLHRQTTPGEQRIQTPATASIVKSRQCPAHAPHAVQDEPVTPPLGLPPARTARV